MADHWQTVEADLHEIYGIDMHDCWDRPWEWLEGRVAQLLLTPVGHATVPADEGWRVEPQFRTRTQALFFGK